jgi:hypothetical protein
MTVIYLVNTRQTKIMTFLFFQRNFSDLLNIWNFIRITVKLNATLKQLGLLKVKNIYS